MHYLMPENIGVLKQIQPLGLPHTIFASQHTPSWCILYSTHGSALINMYVCQIKLLTCMGNL